ncbi:MAG: hypothetical protein AB7G37_16530, partial [Solirubrobacteraceae bacterium]
LRRVVTSATDDLFEVATAWMQGEGDQSRAGLLDAVRHVVVERRHHGPVLDALDEVAGYDADIAEYWTARMEGFITVVRARMERDRDLGRLPEGVDVAETAHMLAWGIERTIGRRVLSASAEDDEGLVRTVARAIWSALYGPGWS